MARGKWCWCKTSRVFKRQRRLRLCAASNFIALIPSRLIRRMLANVLELNPKGFYQISRKKKKIVAKNGCVADYLVLDKTWNKAGTRCGRATTAKKCTKKRDARAKLLFCQSKPKAFLPFSVPSPLSLLLKLPTVIWWSSSFYYGF